MAIKKVEVTDENSKALATEIYMMKTCPHPNIVTYHHAYFHLSLIWVRINSNDSIVLFISEFG